VATRLEERVQPSYRHSHEPDVLACEAPVELSLDTWQGKANQRVTLHPSGVVTFEITMGLGPDGVTECSSIEEDFYQANAIRYLPYLRQAYGQDADPPSSAATDRGVDLISPVIELRQLLAGVVHPRPQGIVYPATDMRTIVSAVASDLHESAEHLVRQFVDARRERAQLATGPADLEVAEFDVQKPRVMVQRWGCVVFASCDVDAVLLVASTEERQARVVAVDCVAMAQSMWFIARTWVGVLDGIETVEAGSTRDEEQLRDLQQKVIDFSAAEAEIQSSMATVEAAGVMLRDSWHVQLIGVTLQCLEVDLQRRLIDQRVSALSRNHATVAEILDRVHQNAARAQADRLQYLFAVAVAAAVADMVLTIADLGDLLPRVVVGLGTLMLVWASLAAGIWLVGRRRMPAARVPEPPPATSSGGPQLKQGRVVQRQRRAARPR
jgi:hypothetical protein